MTIPSEGINPWRGLAGPSAEPAPTAKTKSEQALKDDEAGATDHEFKAFGDDGFTFWDLIDVINPLQHLPIVSTFYRDWTGDEIDPASRIAGGTLFLGPLGGVASLANVWLEQETGKDAGEHVLAMFREDSGPLSAPSKTADAAPAKVAAAGTDGIDPVTAWAREQNAYYRGDAANGATVAAAGTDGIDPVGDWAREQNAFYRGGGATVAAAGAPGADPVTAWAQAQNAYYGGGAARPQVAQSEPVAEPGAADPVSAWAARQQAFYQARPVPAGPATPAAPAAATATTEVAEADAVTTWATAQNAYYKADGRQGAAQTAATGQAATGQGDATGDVSAWARDQLAWVMGDRAREVAAATTQPATRSDDDRRERQVAEAEPAADGAAAPGGGWFRDNMLDGWTKYNAARQLAEPGYRPGLMLTE